MFITLIQFWFARPVKNKFKSRSLVTISILRGISRWGVLFFPLLSTTYRSSSVLIVNEYTYAGEKDTIKLVQNMKITQLALPCLHFWCWTLISCGHVNTGNYYKNNANIIHMVSTRYPFSVMTTALVRSTSFQKGRNTVGNSFIWA